MGIDRSTIRVKAMLVAPSADGMSHLVSVNAPTTENPRGYHRLIGGSVAHGDEELGARIHGLEHVGIGENIFRFNGEIGHEIVALYSGSLDPAPGVDGGTLTESDGSAVPVVWRSFDDAGHEVPLYPTGAADLIRTSREGREGDHGPARAR